MKKAKIMLAALAVFAVVGTTLAFKARSNDTIYIDADHNGISDTPVTGVKLTVSSDPDAFQTNATNALNVATVSTFALETGN